jgi:hypothetical protein
MGDLRQKLLVVLGAGAFHSGNLRSRSIAWKRGSSRSGSKYGSTFSDDRLELRRRTAVFSHWRALAMSPYCALDARIVISAVVARRGFKSVQQHEGELRHVCEPFFSSTARLRMKLDV